MADGSVKLDNATMKRLRMFLVKKYEGEIYGKIGETVSKAVNEYLDRQEKKEKPKKEAI